MSDEATGGPNDAEVAEVMATIAVARDVNATDAQGEAADDVIERHVLGSRRDDGSWPMHCVPRDFYDARASLSLIRDHAVEALVPPDVVLGHVLNSVALAMPLEICLPPFVGITPSPVNFGVVLVARTGIGKTAGETSARGSMDESWPTIAYRPLGTGQGLTDALLGPADAETGEREPHGLPTWVHSDEGRQLSAETASRKSILAGVLCSAVSGGPLGQDNATKSLNRNLPAGTYKVGITLNIQPHHLEGVLADVESGLPQRFLFLYGHGWWFHEAHDAGHVDFMPPDRYLSLPPLAADDYDEIRGRRVVGFPDEVRREVRLAHIARMVAGDRGEPVDRNSQRNLLRMRVAALLARLEGRPFVETDDWTLAKMVVDASDAVIQIGNSIRAFARMNQEAARQSTEVRTALATDDARRESEAERTARHIVSMVSDAETDGRWQRKRIRSQLTQSKREVLDEALDICIEQGWLLPVKELNPDTKRYSTVYRLGAERP